jgi:hypothetical protein
MVSSVWCRVGQCSQTDSGVACCRVRRVGLVSSLGLRVSVRVRVRVRVRD